MEPKTKQSRVRKKSTTRSHIQYICCASLAKPKNNFAFCGDLREICMCLRVYVCAGNIKKLMKFIEMLHVIKCFGGNRKLMNCMDVKNALNADLQRDEWQTLWREGEAANTNEA